MTDILNAVRFIHSSDWQLGITRAFLGDEAGARYSQARIDAVVAMGRLALEHDAKFIVVAGDVFESSQISRQTLVRAIHALESLPVPVFLLPGNHDPLDGASIFATPEFETAAENVFVLRDTAPLAVPGLEGVEVVGAPWRSKHPNSDLCRDLAESLEPAEGLIRIAVAHGQVDLLSPDITRPEIIDLRDVEQAIHANKFHYLALGDRHSVTDVGTTGRVWYSGTPVTTAFDEVEPNKVLLVDVSSAGECHVARLHTGAWSFVAHEHAINGSEDVALFEQWLNALPDKECTAVKVGFEGSVNLATAAELDGLMAEKAELFASLRRRERTTDLAIVPDEFDEDSVALSGYARQTWDELLALAKGGDEAASDALRLFYRISGEGKG